MHIPSVPANATISVIIPTTCELKRSDTIERAIRSVEAQEGVAVETVIVVNGDRYDKTLLTKLKANTGMKIIQLAEGNVSLARYKGVLESTGKFFCFLDDDDEFLPDAMHQRVSFLTKHQHADVIVTNGFFHQDGDKLWVPPNSSDYINNDPAGTFLKANWFASPASAFRRSSIDTKIFDIKLKYFEWTYLFFLLLSKGKSIQYSESVTYRVYKDNPLSISKSDEYFRSHLEFLRILQQLPLSPTTQKALKAKQVIALNSLSNYHLTRKDWKSAWIAHFQCLFGGGWRFLPYTRHLILPRPAQKER